MSETPLTTYCNHMYDLVQRVRHIILDDVVPVSEEQLRQRPRESRKRDNAIQITFMRIIRWLMTFEKLNSTHDIQAVGAGARGVFEHYLDLRLFERMPGEKYLDRFWAFPDVDRYRAAKKMVERKRADPDCKLDVTPQEQWMKQKDTPVPLAEKVAKLWGTHPKTGKPLWPGDHWSGEGKLPQRTKLLGADCEDMYVQIYSTLCALVHPGPTPVVGQKMDDFNWIEQQIAYGYFLTFMNARSSMILTCDLLKIREHVKRLDSRLQQLDRWTEEAKRHLPRC